MDTRSDLSAMSPEELKPDDGEKRQNTRACDFCHRMKMKCIGKETPPCNRCRQSGQQCTFDGPRKSKAAKVEDRLKVVEEQMADVQASLAELIALQRASASANASVTGAPVETSSTMPGVRVGSAPTEDKRSLASATYPRPGDSYSHSNSQSNSHPHSQHYPHTRSPYQPIFNNFDRSRDSAPHALSAPPQYTGPSRQSAAMPHDATSPRVPHRHARSHNSPLERDRPSSPPLAESGEHSEDEDDPLEPSIVIFNNMLRLAEAARLKEDGQLDNEHDIDRRRQHARASDDRRPLKRTSEGPFDYSIDGKRPKRADEAILKRALPIQRGNLMNQVQNPMELGFCTEQKGRQLFDLFMQGAAVYVPIFDPETDTWEHLCKTAPFTITVLIMVGSKIEDAGGPPSELQKKCKDHAENIAMRTLFTPVARIDVLQGMIVLSSWGDTSWRPSGHALRIAMDMGLYRCLPYLAASGMGSDKTPAELEEERMLVVGARCWLAVYKSEFEMAFNLGRPALFAVENTLDHGRKFLEHPLSLPTDSRLVATCELLTLRLSMHQLYSIWPEATRIPNLDERIEAANASYTKWFKYWESYYQRLGIPRSNFLHETLYSQHAHAVLHTNSRILHDVRSRRQVALLSEKRQGFLVKALRSAETLVSMALRGASYTANFAKANYYTHLGVAFAARMIIRLTSLIPEHVADLRQTGRDLEEVTECLARVPGFQFAQHIREVVVKARRAHVLPPSSRAPSPTRRSAAVPLDRIVSRDRDRDREDKGEKLDRDRERQAERDREREKERDRQREEKERQHERERLHLHDQEHMQRYTTLTPRDTTSLSTSASPKVMTSALRRSASPEKQAPGLTLLPSPNLPHDFIYAEQLFAGRPGLELQTFDATEMLDPEPLFNMDMWFPYPPLESDGGLGLAGSPYSTGVTAGGFWQ